MRQTDDIRTTMLLGIAGIIASILVGAGEYLLHYSPTIFDHVAAYQFLGDVPLDHLKMGHFLAIIGLPFYFAGYLHVYRMLRSGNETLARITLAFAFIAFGVGGIWIGSRGFLGTIVHQQADIPAVAYQQILQNYSEYMEVLVKALRIIIALLSVFFVTSILKGGTYYRKWMIFFNPLLILLVWVLIGKMLPEFGKHSLPILMNITHLVMFSLSLYNLHLHVKQPIS